MRILYKCTLGVFYSTLVIEAYCLIDLSLYSFQIVKLLHTIFEIFRCFSECNDGFSGENCSRMCTYPSYGPKCKLECACSNDSCHFANGCSNQSTKKYIIDHIRIF